ncbi:molybdopterin-guanine dinucleotide biosynthesis protein MobA [Bacillus sp. JCM 19047]|nr:molybdopterin-guanine dinucleotide biosynthesis protein MobA [Bacillus sp. JCM 19047]
MTGVGLILAGGQSKRYGKQKLFENYHNQPLVFQSIQAFKQAHMPYFIVTNNELANDFNGDVPIIVEQTAHLGPLSALCTGLEHIEPYGYSYVHVLAGDLPYIEASFVLTMQRYAQTFPESRILLPVQNEREQPLHAIYRLGCLQAIRALLPEQTSMRALYKGQNTKRLSFPNDVRFFKNINRTTDWRD